MYTLSLHSFSVIYSCFVCVSFCLSNILLFCLGWVWPLYFLEWVCLRQANLKLVCIELPVENVVKRHFKHTKNFYIPERRRSRRRERCQWIIQKVLEKKGKAKSQKLLSFMFFSESNAKLTLQLEIKKRLTFPSSFYKCSTKNMLCTTKACIILYIGNAHTCKEWSGF